MKKTIITILLLSLIKSLVSQSSSEEKFEIYFDNNSCVISSKFQNIIIEKLKLEPNSNIIEIKIFAHCDKNGSNELNNKLSENRALAVLNFLSLNNIKPEIIKHQSFGKNQLKYFSDKDSLNRRAEIVITKLIVLPKVVIEPKTKSVAQNEIKQVETKTKASDIIDANVGDLISFDAIQFYPGQAEPLPQSKPVMLQIAEVLNEHQNIEIEIQGHICCISTDDEDISTKRAKCVYDYLIDQGIDKRRLRYKGYGHTRPKTDESTPQLTQMNRRVEIKIIKK